MQQYLWIILFAVAGFLIGGVWALRRTAKVFAVILALGAALALYGGVSGVIAWLR